jgi:hypothetical protein
MRGGADGTRAGLQSRDGILSRHGSALGGGQEYEVEHVPQSYRQPYDGRVILDTSGLAEPVIPSRGTIEL